MHIFRGHHSWFFSRLSSAIYSPTSSTFFLFSSSLSLSLSLSSLLQRIPKETKMAATIDYTPTSHKAINQVRRPRNSGRYDAESIHAILDNNLVAHVGFTLPPGAAEEDDWPFVMPMCYGRIEDTVYLHGY